MVSQNTSKFRFPYRDGYNGVINILSAPAEVATINGNTYPRFAGLGGGWQSPNWALHTTLVSFTTMTEVIAFKCNQPFSSWADNFGFAQHTRNWNLIYYDIVTRNRTSTDLIGYDSATMNANGDYHQHNNGAPQDHNTVGFQISQINRFNGQSPYAFWLHGEIPMGAYSYIIKFHYTFDNSGRNGIVNNFNVTVYCYDGYRWHTSSKQIPIQTGGSNTYHNTHHSSNRGGSHLGFQVGTGGYYNHSTQIGIQNDMTWIGWSQNDDMSVEDQDAIVEHYAAQFVGPSPFQEWQNDESIGFKLQGSYKNVDWNDMTLAESVGLSDDKRSVIWNNQPITSTEFPNWTIATLVDRPFGNNFELVLSIELGYACKLGAIIGQNIDTADFVGSTSTYIDLNTNNLCGFTGGVANYSSGGDARDSNSGYKYLYVQLGADQPGYGTDIHDPHANYSTVNQDGSSTYGAFENDPGWLGNIGYFGRWDDQKCFIRIKRIGKTIRINQSIVSPYRGYKNSEYIANLTQIKDDDHICILINTYFWSWAAPIIQLPKIEYSKEYESTNAQVSENLNPITSQGIPKICIVTYDNSIVQESTGDGAYFSLGIGNSITVSGIRREPSNLSSTYSEAIASLRTNTLGIGIPTWTNETKYMYNTDGSQPTSAQQNEYHIVNFKLANRLDETMSTSAKNTVQSSIFESLFGIGDSLGPGNLYHYRWNFDANQYEFWDGESLSFQTQPLNVKANFRYVDFTSNYRGRFSTFSGSTHGQFKIGDIFSNEILF